MNTRCRNNNTIITYKPMNERKPVEAYKEIANDCRDLNRANYPIFDYDDLLKSKHT